MKKFIFSAVAMIAFVGSSMANDIADKDLEIIVDKISKVEDSTAERNCRAEQAATVKYAKEVMGMNDKDAATAGYIIFFDCKSDNLNAMTFSIQQTN